MDYIQWNEKLSVKVESIDNQHKKLLGLINDVNRALESGANRKILSEIFKGLIDYTQEHFAYEEKLFIEYSYRNSIMHKIEHSRFIEKVLNLYRDFIYNEDVDLNQILIFLLNWLQNHIQVTDMEFGKHIIRSKV